MDLEETLGIDRRSPINKLADRLVHSDYAFIDELISWRVERGLTQAIVAERMGVSEATVKELEHYSTNPPLSLIRRYSLSVGVMVHHQIEPVIDEQCRPN